MGFGCGRERSARSSARTSLANTSRDPSDQRYGACAPSWSTARNVRPACSSRMTVRNEPRRRERTAQPNAAYPRSTSRSMFSSPASSSRARASAPYMFPTTMQARGLRRSTSTPPVAAASAAASAGAMPRSSYTPTRPASDETTTRSRRRSAIKSRGCGCRRRREATEEARRRSRSRHALESPGWGARR